MPKNHPSNEDMKQIGDKFKPWEYEDISSVVESDLLHDENFNNKIKINMEHSLAKAIIELPTTQMLANVCRVSAAILPFIQYIKDHSNDIAKSMYNVFVRHVGANSDQFARDDTLGDSCESIPEERARETLLTWLETMLTKVEPNPKELLSIVRIHLAADYVLFDQLLKPNQGNTEIGEEQREALNLIVPDLSSREKIESSLFSNDGLNMLHCEAYQKRGRINRNKPQPLTQQFGLFPAALINENQLPPHRRGIDLFRVRANYRSGEPQSKYVDIAIDKDMPIVCSISTTALRLLRFAAVLTSMSVKDYWDYALPHLSYNILGGHHTFHEYASIMALVGIPYRDGVYKSLFLKSNPVHKFLCEAYPDSFTGENADIAAEKLTLDDKLLCEALLEINQSYEVDTTYRL